MNKTYRNSLIAGGLSGLTAAFILFTFLTPANPTLNLTETQQAQAGASASATPSTATAKPSNPANPNADPATPNNPANPANPNSNNNSGGTETPTENTEGAPVYDSGCAPNVDYFQKCLEGYIRPVIIFDQVTQCQYLGNDAWRITYRLTTANSGWAGYFEGPTNSEGIGSYTTQGIGIDDVQAETAIPLPFSGVIYAAPSNGMKGFIEHVDYHETIYIPMRDICTW